MQTFLPYFSFVESAKCLDFRRLGKQRIETWQILQALSNPNYGWQNHPAVNQWRGYDYQLANYGLVICREWTKRGYRDTMADKISERLMDIHEDYGNYGTVNPDWLGLEKFHLSHKSNLIRKFPEHYGKLWPDVPNNIEYYWPTKHCA